MNTKLKPCPFCGHRTIFTAPDEIGNGGQWVAPIHVGCNKCGAEQIGDDEESARANWNRRAALQSQSTDTERLDWLDGVAHCADWMEDEPTKRVIRAHDGAEFTGDTWREAIDHARRVEGDV